MKIHFRKFLSLILACMLLFSLAACGKQTPVDGILFKSEDSVELGTPATTLNPETVYANLVYTPEMFFGDYALKGGTDAQKEYAKTAQYLPYTIAGEDKMLTSVPVAFLAGRHNLHHKLSYATECNWAQVSFMRRTDSNDYVYDYFYCAYEVDGKKLIIRPLDAFEIDDASNKITYDFSDIVMEYDFAFKGRTLTLSSNGVSIDLTGGLEAYGKHDFLSTDAYPSSDESWLEDIQNIDLLYDPEYTSYNRAAFRNANGDFFDNSIAKMEENGLITMTVANDTVQKTYQFVYFYCSYDGIILTDGTKTYYYNYDYTDFHKGVINKYVSEENADLLSALSEEEVKEIVEKTEDLYADLAQAFSDAGIQVTIDKQNGELAVDSSILFGGDSAELSAEGKAFLNKFVDVYTSIIYSDKYAGFVEKTLIEGHTAPIQGSTYESGLPLSKQRAENVKAYCLSDETGTDTSGLSSSLEAIGLSNSKPVKDASGNVDLAASRRVSFRFVIHLQ